MSEGRQSVSREHGQKLGPNTAGRGQRRERCEQGPTRCRLANDWRRKSRRINDGRVITMKQITCVTSVNNKNRIIRTKELIQ